MGYWSGKAFGFIRGDIFSQNTPVTFQTPEGPARTYCKVSSSTEHFLQLGSVLYIQPSTFYIQCREREEGRGSDRYRQREQDKEERDGRESQSERKGQRQRRRVKETEILSDTRLLPDSVAGSGGLHILFYPVGRR
jgi:hypothetical protein